MHNNKDLRGGLPLPPAEEQAQKAQSGKCEAVEVIIDHDFVSIPRSRYDELLKAENWLDMIVSLYRSNAATYQITDLLEAMFGPREEGGNA